MVSLNLKGMNVVALMSLREQVDKRLQECRAEIEKQLAALQRPTQGQVGHVVIERQEGPAEVS